MSRPPPRSTRTYTLFPYTTLFRAVVAYEIACANAQIERIFGIDAGDTVAADARDTISEAEVETALDGEDDLVRGLVVIACEHPGAAGIVRAIDDGGAYVGLCSSDVVFVPTGLGTEIRALEWSCRGGGGNRAGSTGPARRTGGKE